jgi:hypothetical protein
MRDKGLSYDEISTMLNAQGVPTPTGRPLWQKSYVDRLLHTQYALEIAKDIYEKRRGSTPLTAGGQLGRATKCPQNGNRTVR